jgi:large subunit ribosomal protein L10Ae
MHQGYSPFAPPPAPSHFFNLQVCVLGDVKHCEQAQSIGVDARSVEDLKKLNKNKKLVKKLGE